MASAAAMAPPVTFKTAVVRLAPLARVKRPPCTVALPLTVFWAYHVLLPVTVRFPPMASVPATPPLERVTLLLTWPLPKSVPPWTRTELLVNWPLTASEPPLIVVASRYTCWCR